MRYEIQRNVQTNGTERVSVSDNYGLYLEVWIEVIEGLGVRHEVRHMHYYNEPKYLPKLTEVLNKHLKEYPLMPKGINSISMFYEV